MNKLSVGYRRECITPAIGTYLGGYGNGKDRQTVGKIFEDDDLFVTVIAVTDENNETILICTVDSVRMPVMTYGEIIAHLQELTGITDEHIILNATHSHSAPDIQDGAEYIKTWKALVVEQAGKAALGALADRKPAKVFAAVKEVESLNFVRRYMLNGKFLGTNANGDAHESAADNHLQILKFVREGGEDLVLCNWGAHADHSKCFGGPEGSETYHRGCSADYIYSLRKTVEAKTGAKFAFFQAAAGNLNPVSRIAEEMGRIHGRMEKDDAIRPIAYGRELADEVIDVLNHPMTELNGGAAKGTTSSIMAERAKGPEIGSPEYNRAVALCAVAFARRAIDPPTKESREGADFLQEVYEMGTNEDVERMAQDENDPMHDYAMIVKILRDGGCLGKTSPASHHAGSKLSKFFQFNSGLYSAGGLVRHSENNGLPPVELPIHAVSCGDFAFVGAPGEIFDECGKAVKDASPFKMTFYLELSGGSFGYFPSHRAWANGGYEVGNTNFAEGTAEAIAERQLEMLNKLNKEL